MWGSVLGMALLWALNPALLGIVLLLISRPRPVQNLVFCWVGCLITNVPALLVPLVMLHVMPAFRATADELATAGPNSTARHIQLGIGVAALSISALIAARSLARQRVPAPAGTPTAISLPRGGENDAADGKSAIRRLIGRVNNAWENGSLWVALVIGLNLLPGPLLILLVDTTIVASGAPIGTQVVVAVAFVIAMLAVFEITLVSYLVTPDRTEAMLRPLHEWALAHRAQVLAAIFAVVGLSLVARGAGVI
ncbi:GAP family protein [Mycobacterium sp. 94-17]|uniref:GAP family protein n=1 Tax=Mycobacterium sp. 94-17 TaxID=2986147 RepID=UPI002D1E8F19|nr:GAP family protein [Mycobacterium sp. 94-17]MEB4211823.1 GAP family protein [Mycobacterium sp. 94-17]